MTPAEPLNILIVTFEGGGNVAPMMLVAAGLVGRGHRVRVLSDAVSRDEAEAAGAAFVAWARAPSKTTRERDTTFGDWAAPTTADGVKMLAEHFIGAFALAHALDVMDELDREAADLVICWDAMMGVVAGCEARGRPVALLTTSISNFPMPGAPPLGSALPPPKTDADRARLACAEAEWTAVFDAGLPGLNAARAELGLPPLAHLVDQADAAAACFLGTARAFDFPPDPLPSRYRYVGPLVRDPVWAEPWVSPWPSTDVRPLVLVGFSTSFQNHRACLQRVIDACADLPVRVLATLAGSILNSELTAAANTVIVDSAPHSQVMREASLVVTHGGHGTVMTALMNRLPMLVIPHGRDQGDNALRITERGAGLAVTNSASAAEMRAAISRLLNEPAFAGNARRLGDAVAREAEQSTLLDQIETLAAGFRTENPARARA